MNYTQVDCRLVLYIQNYIAVRDIRTLCSGARVFQSGQRRSAAGGMVRSYIHGHIGTRCRDMGADAWEMNICITDVRT
jgi:hypothetical protein